MCIRFTLPRDAHTKEKNIPLITKYCRDGRYNGLQLNVTRIQRWKKNAINPTGIVRSFFLCVVVQKRTQKFASSIEMQ